jgi:hypothetical protein
MPWMALAAVAAPIVGGVLGNVMSQGDRNKAKAAMKKAIAELENVGYPPDLSKEIIYKQFEQVGMLTPELEEDLALAASEYASIKEDPELRKTQLEALNKFKQQSETGMGAEERSALNSIQQATRQDVRAKQDQILADQQRRGMGGSGNELIAQLNASQAGADSASAQGNELMSMIAQRVRQGAQDMSGAAANVRGQDYQVASDKATALDARNQYLNQNSTARQMRNVASKNEAAGQNLSEEQRVNEMNTNLGNQEKLRQVNEEGTFFDRKLDLAGKKAAAYTGQQNYYSDQAKQTADMYAGMGKGVGEGVSAFAKK